MSLSMPRPSESISKATRAPTKGELRVSMSRARKYDRNNIKGPEQINNQLQSGMHYANSNLKQHLQKTGKEQQSLSKMKPAKMTGQNNRLPTQHRDYKQIEDIEQIESENPLEGYYPNKGLEIHTPYIILGSPQIQYQQISTVLCAFANDQKGGCILIHESIKKEKVTKQLRFIMENIQENVKISLQQIAFSKYINIKVEIIPVSQKNTIEKYSEEFVIRIHVRRNQRFRNQFFIEDIKQNKSFREFYYIGKNEQSQKERRYFITKIKQELELIQIYGQILSNFRQKYKNIPRISTQKKCSIKITLAHLRESQQKFKCLRSLDSSSNFLGCIDKERMKINFKKLSKNQKAAFCVLNQKLDVIDAIRRIKEFLKQSKQKYKLFMPFPDIQNAYKELKQNKNSKIKISSAFYIILESSFQNLKAGVKKNFNNQVSITQITKKITIKQKLKDKQGLQNFLWDNFGCLTKINRPPPAQKPIQLVAYEYNFRQQNMDAAMFAYFVQWISK